MRILFLEPFFGGSHKYFALGLKKHSSHSIELKTLPGRFWKWRMRGASLHFLSALKNLDRYDLIMAGNLMDISQWKALSPACSPPVILYMHENQLAYPVKKGEERDFQYGWTDFTNQLCAERVVYNSHYNKDSFFRSLEKLFKRLPDALPSYDSAELSQKISVIPPGCDTADSWDGKKKYEKTGESPLILWNHRWEHDKNPEDFFHFLKNLKSRGKSFRLAVLGEAYEKSPECFRNAEELFQKEIVHFGYADSRKEYESWLEKSDFVFSSAIQENFGISIVEAMSFGAIPLLPDRLAYPEVLPEKYHSTLLYIHQEDLLKKWDRLQSDSSLSGMRKYLSEAMQQYSWKNIAPVFDRLFEEVLQSHGS